MKQPKLLVVGFDINSEMSYAVGSIIGYLKQSSFYDFKHENFNPSRLNEKIVIERLVKKYDLVKVKYIAIANYIWSEFLINPIIELLRENRFEGEIILGGYEISFSDKDELNTKYTDCKFFINGYAEKSLLSIVLGNGIEQFVNKVIDFTKIGSPYLENALMIKDKQDKVVLETKRGCPFKCKFCAHRDFETDTYNELSLDKVFKEIDLFCEKDVKKINIIDPVFNIGNHYIKILEYFVNVKYKNKISIQIRIDLLKENEDETKKFLKLCMKLNITLEIGIQTVIDEELKAIGRKNIKDKAKYILSYCNKNSIDYEFSLIYGLPLQTVDSFKKSVFFLNDNYCRYIIAFPLMLLKGTELYRDSDKYNFKVKPIGEYKIPHVVSSNSFSEEQWKQMQTIANNLNGNK